MSEKPKTVKELSARERIKRLMGRDKQFQADLLSILSPEEQLRFFTEEQLRTGNYDERLTK